MQIHIAEQHADRTPLRRPLFARLDHTVLQNARLQPAPDQTDQARTRYHKIGHDTQGIEALFLDLFLEAYDASPGEIVLDLDATDDPLHGHQEGRFFHGYCNCYWYLPLYIFCGRHTAFLQPGRIEGRGRSQSTFAARSICGTGSRVLRLSPRRGLRQSSIAHCRHYLRVFERHLGDIGCDPELLTLPVVTAFIMTQASHFGRTAMISLASILRVFLRYLHREHVLQRDISNLVEIPQRYRLADIPRSISWGSVQAMLDQVDRRTVVGRRDYAMLLLMALYGLRSREVALLTLDDIDWKRDRLHVRGRKAEHSTTYPLVPVVGEAIVGYLRNGRPDIQGRLLFWRHLAPQLPPTHSAVSATASKYLHRAGIPVSRPGSHTLRHACVQRLVDTGFSLKTIGDYVGHRAVSSTMIYAKVQVGGLREVALGDGVHLQ